MQAEKPGTERLKPVLALLASVGICLLPGILGSLFTRPAIPTWYAALLKPPFTPPGWLFGPVWTALYLSMGVSLFLMWRRREAEGARVAITVFGIQLLLNAAWSPVFFGAKALLGGLFVIMALWISVLAAILLSFRISRVAGMILIPYLLWVSFATVLNFELYRLNG